MLDKKDELKDRIEARRLELVAKFNDLKADARHEAGEARDKLKVKLDELETNLKNGWDNVSETVRAKLSQWLDHDKAETKSGTTAETTTAPTTKA